MLSETVQQMLNKIGDLIGVDDVLGVKIFQHPQDKFL